MFSWIISLPRPHRLGVFILLTRLLSFHGSQIDFSYNIAHLHMTSQHVSSYPGPSPLPSSYLPDPFCLMSPQTLTRPLRHFAVYKINLNLCSSTDTGPHDLLTTTVGSELEVDILTLWPKYYVTKSIGDERDLGHHSPAHTPAYFNYKVNWNEAHYQHIHNPYICNKNVFVFSDYNN